MTQSVLYSLPSPDEVDVNLEVEVRVSDDEPTVNIFDWFRHREAQILVAL